MAQLIRPIKLRIRSIENTLKVTASLQMVSASKLNKASVELLSLRNYLSGLESMVIAAVSSVKNFEHPLLRKPSEHKRLILCVVTSDNGLCGAFNSAVLRVAEWFMKEHQGKEVSLVCVGQKAFSVFKGKPSINMIAHLEAGRSGRIPVQAENLQRVLQDMYLDKKADEVYICYNRFKTVFVQQPRMEKLFAIELPIARRTDYILEPDAETLLHTLIQQYISIKVRCILLDAFTSEHASRVVAMKAATENAKEFLVKLEGIKNRMRQAYITQDIMEIIAGAEALKE